jgi:hypothetical protein
MAIWNPPLCRTQSFNVTLAPLQAQKLDKLFMIKALAAFRKTADNAASDC